MERIERALQKAQVEREQILLSRATIAEPAAPESKQPERTRTIGLNPAALEASRLLLPGMTGVASHSFKILRTQVMRRMKQRGWNSLAVMSAAPDEGKTFTAINLAIAIAADTDLRVVLVDLDLRAPRVHKRFGFEPQAGVEDCLRGDADLADALVNPEGYLNLTLLPARQAVEHSSELITSARARAVFDEIKQRYANRVVIFDLPPVLGSDDALAFAAQVDTALIVIGDNLTRREELERCLELMRDIPIVGTVLNGSRSERSAEYAYGH